MEHPTEEKLRFALHDAWGLWRAHSGSGERRQVRLRPSCGPDEIWAAVQCLLSGKVATGEAVARFEDECASRLGSRFAVLVNSGSSASLLAVAALCNPSTAGPLRPGDEVIVPALSCPTAVWPLVQHGLIPVVVDVDPTTYTMDPDEAEAAVGPRTRAILPVHLSGNPCDMKSLARIAREKSLTLLEDCRGALGASIAGAGVGRFSRVATFGFSCSQDAASIEGGICATDHFEIAEILRSLRGCGGVDDLIDPGRHRRAHPELAPQSLYLTAGYDVRPTELQGAIGSIQLSKLGGFLDSRSKTAEGWKRELEKWGADLAVQRETPSGRSAWAAFPIIVREGAPFTSGDLAWHLNSRGIETRPMARAQVAAQPGLRSYPHRVVGDLAKANHVVTHGFALPTHQDIDSDLREYVAQRIREFVVR